MKYSKYIDKRTNFFGVIYTIFPHESVIFPILDKKTADPDQTNFAQTVSNEILN